MKSETLPAFWDEYRKLSNPIKKRARKTYRLWIDNPFHPSLHFKCIDSKEGIWSITLEWFRSKGEESEQHMAAALKIYAAAQKTAAGMSRFI